MKGHDGMGCTTTVGKEKIAKLTKEFMDKLGEVSHAYDKRDVFTDFVRAYHLALLKPVLLQWGEYFEGGAEKSREYAEECEKEYMSYVAKYGKDGWRKVLDLATIVVDALETQRRDFLGHVVEAIGAANAGNGQFFTPPDVSRLMAQITTGERDVERDKEEVRRGGLVRIGDCAGGAGVLMIECAEEMIDNKGYKQGDIFIDHGDLDGRACDIAYIQYTLLGYGAVVRHQNTLTMQDYEKPQYTVGFFLHRMPMKLERERGLELVEREEAKEETAEKEDVKAEAEDDDKGSVSMTQGELGL